MRWLSCCGSGEDVNESKRPRCDFQRAISSTIMIIIELSNTFGSTHLGYLYTSTAGTLGLSSLVAAFAISDGGVAKPIAVDGSGNAMYRCQHAGDLISR